MPLQGKYPVYTHPWDMVTVCYIFWMSAEMDTISQRMCNWVDKGWMIGTGHKQFFCQGYGAWLIKLPTLTDPCQNHPTTLAPPVCWSSYQWSSHIILHKETEKSSRAHICIPCYQQESLSFSQGHKTTCCTGRSLMAGFLVWYFEAMIFNRTVAGRETYERSDFPHQDRVRPRSMWSKQ